MDKILQDRIQLNLDGLDPTKDRAMVDLWAEGFRKGGIPVRAFFGGDHLPAFGENRLTGEEIKTLLFDSRITGIDPISGYQWWLDRTKNGKFTWRGTGPIASDTGNSWNEGDAICARYEKRFGGLEVCATVFRNPAGTYGKKDEYFYCSDLGFSPFSLVK